MGFDVTKRLALLKNSAKTRNIPVNLDVNKYQVLINLGCHFCGSDLKNENGYCLDRIDSRRGYVFSNVVGCCKICNRAKSNMDVWEFVNWLKKANDFTQDKIKMVEEAVRRGENFDNIDKQTEDLFNEVVKDKPKNRIKFVPS